MYPTEDQRWHPNMQGKLLNMQHQLYATSITHQIHHTFCASYDVRWLTKRVTNWPTNIATCRTAITAKSGRKKCLLGLALVWSIRWGRKSLLSWPWCWHKWQKCWCLELISSCHQHQGLNLFHSWNLYIFEIVTSSMTTKGGRMFRSDIQIGWYFSL